MILAPRFTPILVALLFVAPPLVAEAPAADAPVPQQARELMERQHWRSARTLLESESAAHPDDPATLSALADVRAQFGDVAEAEKLARRAVALAPRDAQAHETLASVLGRQAQKAGMFKAMHIVGEFRKQAEAAIALDPARVESRDMLMQFYLQAPGIAGGDKKKARIMADEIARIDAAKGELALAEYSAAVKDTNAVEGCYRRAIAKDPKSADAHLSLASWLAAPARARWDDAAAEARAGLAADPARPGGYALLAIIAVRRGQIAELDPLLADFDAHCPDQRGAWYQAGRELLVSGRELPRAEHCFHRYLEVEPEPNNPTAAHAHWRLANVLEKEGRNPEALAELKTALSLKPDLDEAKKDLKRLQH